MQSFLAICLAWDPRLLGVRLTGNFKEFFRSIECNETVLPKKLKIQLLSRWEPSRVRGKTNLKTTISILEIMMSE